MNMIWQSERTEVEKSTPAPVNQDLGNWNLLTNHAHLLICLLRNNNQTLRAVSDQIGITERAAQRIVAELESAGVLTREKIGRTNRYTINHSTPLPHPLESGFTLGDLLLQFGSSSSA